VVPSSSLISGFGAAAFSESGTGRGSAPQALSTHFAGSAQSLSQFLVVMPAGAVRE